MDKDDHAIELLRHRLAQLTLDARKNDEAWRRAQRREMDLLEAESLGALLERLTTGLQSSYRLTTATLVVADPDHEIRRLIAVLGSSAAGSPTSSRVGTTAAICKLGCTRNSRGAPVKRRCSLVS